VRELVLEPGQALFEEGEPSEEVAFVLEGEVEVLRRLGGREVPLGIVGPGEYVGEMGVIEGRRRVATVRARTRVRVRLIDRATFFDTVVRDPERARELLLRMSERLRNADDRLAGLLGGAGGRRPASRQSRLLLYPDSDETARHLPGEGLAITRLPFLVGRRPGPGEPAAARPADLALPEQRPYRLSRQHFVILEGPQGPELADAGSTLGTIVDDVPLGEHFPHARIALAPGAHVIVAGGIRSPWRFRLEVLEADTGTDRDPAARRLA